MVKSKFKQIIKDENSGEIMLESTIIMVFTLLMLIAIISVGFMFYQKIAIDTLANDIASDIASTYKLTNIAGSSEELPYYRTTFSKNKVAEKHKNRAEQMLEERIGLVSLGVNNEASVVSCNAILDNVGRMHIEIEIQSKSLLLFGGALEFFGIENASPTFTSVGRAECLDITAFSGQVCLVEYVGRYLNSNEGLSAGLSSIVSIIRDVKSILSVFGVDFDG